MRSVQILVRSPAMVSVHQMAAVGIVQKVVSVTTATYLAVETASQSPSAAAATMVPITLSVKAFMKEAPAPRNVLAPLVES